ncbi:MAG: RES family NAD+ phosphorylase [Casimicrobiaceae bacterium]
MSLLARRTQWRPSHRLVPSRFPPIGLFDRVARPEDLEAVFELEALTNDRVRDEIGTLALVPKEERISGPGTTPIMAAFTHLNPEGSRFSDGSFGVYYCAREVDTALAEVRYHQARFLRRTAEGPMRLQLRLYLADLDARLIDVRKVAECHRPDDYAPSQQLGIALRAEARDGIVYRSVRREGGLCAAVFRPRLLRRCRQSKHYAFHFDGKDINAIEELTAVWSGV